MKTTFELKLAFNLLIKSVHFHMHLMGSNHKKYLLIVYVIIIVFLPTKFEYKILSKKIELFITRANSHGLQLGI